MAIKPNLARKTNKNPPILSHEFVIQNHADIISCVAMIFVVGLMDATAAKVSSVFITLHHNVTGEEPTRENPYGKPFSYVAGLKDYGAIFFYMLTCIIIHAVIQEFALDKISKKLHLSKYKLSLFNESSHLLIFYLVSFVWGVHVIWREGYFTRLPLLWQDFPNHPMSFLHKFFFIIQMSYYLHMLPELYFQKVKKEDWQPIATHALSGFLVVFLAYNFGFQRIGLLLITLHYLSELVTHSFQLLSVFDREEKLAELRIVQSASFISVRAISLLLGVVTLYYGVVSTQSKLRALIGLVALTSLQGFFIYTFLAERLRQRREAKREAKQQAQSKKKAINKEKSNKQRKKISDLPEADQAAATAATAAGKQKVKSK